MFPGVTQKILTTPVQGYSDPAKIMHLLRNDKNALKVYVEVA
jgi:hypothetical protein